MINETPQDLRDAARERLEEDIRESRVYCDEISTWAGKDDFTWGFTIYRTVYRPGSDEQFSHALGIIDQWIQTKVFSEVELYEKYNSLPEPADSEPNQQVWRRYRNEIIEDRDQLDGATIDNIRERHVSLMASQGRDLTWNSRYRYPIMIDEQVLDMLLQSPYMTPGTKPIQPLLYSVIVIDATGEDIDELPDYEGWVWCPCWDLVELWFQARDSAAEEWYRSWESNGATTCIYIGSSTY